MLQELNAEDWQYLAEGEMHFVVYYKGSSHQFEDKILRIKKLRT